MGSGKKTFTSGEVLTASDVNNYLMEQSVMVFSGTAARSSAIGTANFEEGMLTYLTDVDKLQVYTGAAFSDVYPAAASNQGLTLISTTTFSGVSSQNVTSVFSSTYTNYKIFLDVAGSTTLTPVSLRLLSGTTPNTTTNYNRQVMFLSGTTFDNERNTGLTSFAVGRAQSSGRFQSWAEIVYPFASENTQVWSFIQVEIANPYFRSEAGTLSVTTSYDGFQIFPVAGTMTGSVSVYGYSK